MVAEYSFNSTDYHTYFNLFFFSFRESLMNNLESSLQQKKDDIARFEAERTDLIAKVHHKYCYNC